MTTYYLIDLAFTFTLQLKRWDILGHYIKNNLIRDEHIAFEGHYHWITFFTLRGLLTLFIAPLIDRYSDEFDITNKRVVVKTGVIKRNTLEMNLNKIESVNVDQSILGRLLGYGTITIIGTGGTHETFSNIANALEFRKLFQELSS